MAAKKRTLDELKEDNPDVAAASNAQVLKYKCKTKINMPKLRGT